MSALEQKPPELSNARPAPAVDPVIVLRSVRIKAVVLSVLAIILAFYLLSTRHASKEWAEKNCRVGEWLEQQGDFIRAREHYEAVLARFPRYPRALLLMARLLDQRLGDNEGALYYCRRLKSLSRKSVGYDVDPHISVLTEICQERIEDPWDAMRDMLRMAELNAKVFFPRRMSNELMMDVDKIFQRWKSRGQFKAFVYRRIIMDGDKASEAIVNVLFEDGITRSYRLEINKTGLWILCFDAP